MLMSGSGMFGVAVHVFVTNVNIAIVCKFIPVIVLASSLILLPGAFCIVIIIANPEPVNQYQLLLSLWTWYSGTLRYQTEVNTCRLTGSQTQYTSADSL